MQRTSRLGLLRLALGSGMVRCAREAQWEIRQCAGAMLQELHRHAPAVFDDLLELLPA